MIALLAAAATASAAPAGCAAEVPPERWVEELAAAERGYGALDSAAFADQLDAAALDLRCLAVVISPAEAARYHALVGLRLYGAGDGEAAAAAFASARAADPAWTLSDAVVPAGHEVRALVDRDAAGATEALPAPNGVTVWLDGAQADRRPLARPVIAQVLGADGVVQTSAAVAPGEPLPAYPVLAEPAPAIVSVVPVPVPPAPTPTPTPTSPERKIRWGFLAGAGVAGGVSAVLYGLAADGAARFAGPLDADVGRDELFRMRANTNRLVIGSAAAGGVAAVSATLFVVTL